MLLVFSHDRSALLIDMGMKSDDDPGVVALTVANVW